MRGRAFLLFPGPSSLYLVLPLDTIPGLCIIHRHWPLPGTQTGIYVPERKKLEGREGQGVTQRLGLEILCSPLRSYAALGHSLPPLGLRPSFNRDLRVTGRDATHGLAPLISLLLNLSWLWAGQGWGPCLQFP